MVRFIWVELFYIIFSMVISLKDLPSLPELPHRVTFTFLLHQILVILQVVFYVARPKKLEPRRAQYLPEMKMTKDQDQKSHKYIPKPDHVPNEDDVPSPIVTRYLVHSPAQMDDHEDNQAGVVNVDAEVHAHGLGFENSNPDSTQTFRFGEGQGEDLLPSVET